MLSENFTIADDFPPASYDEWRALVEADLKGAPFEKKLVTHTYEGIDIQPLYTRREDSSERDPLGFPGLPPFVRGSRPLGAAATKWDLRQECATPDLAAANRAILDDIDGGATSLLLRLDEACRAGFDPDNPAASELVGSDGMMLYAVDDFGAALRNVSLDRVGTSLDARRIVSAGRRHAGSFLAASGPSIRTDSRGV